MYRLSLVARAFFSLSRESTPLLMRRNSFVKSERQHSKAKQSVEFFVHEPQFHHFRAKKKKNSHRKHFMWTENNRKSTRRENSAWKISLILFVARENFANGRRHARTRARSSSSSSSFGEEFVFCRGGGSFCSVGFCCGRRIVPVGIFFTTRKTIRAVSCSRN